MDKTNKHKYFTAYHEAGHAVIATVVGIPVDFVTMEGKTTYKENATTTDSILVILAGIFAAQSFDNIGLTGWDDLEKATKLLPKDKNLDEFKIQAKILVLKNKKSIAAVAKELLKKTKLTGEEIQIVIKSSTEEINFPGLKKIADVTYEEVKNMSCSKSATQEGGYVKQWYLVEIMDKDTFMSLKLWVDDKTLKEMVTSTWRDRREPQLKEINVKKIEEIQQEIIEMRGYSHFKPILIRDLYNKVILGEKNQYPQASYHIDEGLHGSIAIAELLSKGKIDFFPILACYSEIKE